MKKVLSTLVLFCAISFAQQQVAIVNTEDDGEPQLETTDLNYLTDRLREIAVKTLPQRTYTIMTQQSIVAFLGSQDEMAKKCKDSEGCLAKLGKEINADYIAQARIGRFSGDLTIKVELYGVKSGNLVGSFTGTSEDVRGLLSVLDENAPNLFKKLPGASIVVPVVAGGISGLTTAGGYEYSGSNKRYLVNVNTEPQGAVLSFDGIPMGNCAKSPCKVELGEGNVQIIAALERYETANTTVSVTQNNQNIAIKLKPNFGALTIKYAYLENIGNDKNWNLVIDDEPYYSLEELRLLPGNYDAKLTHDCYEDISFKVGINKGKEETFALSKHIKLKQGGLDLSSEVDGEPVSEPVFVNGKKVGETPFSGTVPVCAEIKVGGEKVDIALKHNGEVKYKHEIMSISDAIIEKYLYRLNNLVMQNFNPPSGTDIAEGTKAKVGFIVKRNGEITEVTLKESSGNSIWDRLAQRAVQITKAPPFPKELTRESISVNFNFVEKGLEMITAGSSKSKFTAYNLTKDKNFAKDIDKVLKNVAGLQKSGKTKLGGRDSGTGGFNDGYAEGGSGGIGDMLGIGGISTKARGSIKAPSGSEIDMDSENSRSKAEIMAVLNARMPGLRNAYNKYLKLKPGFGGKVILKFTIAPSGDVISISIVSSTTDYNDFDNAVKNLVETWKWKAIKKGGNVTPTIPFNFTE